MTLTLREVPREWFPAFLAQGPRHQCGWWLHINSKGIGGKRDFEVRYCSLPIGHVQSCIWMNPPLSPSHWRNT